MEKEQPLHAMLPYFKDNPIVEPNRAHSLAAAAHAPMTASDVDVTMREKYSAHEPVDPQLFLKDIVVPSLLYDKVVYPEHVPGSFPLKKAMYDFISENNGYHVTFMASVATDHYHDVGTVIKRNRHTLVGGLPGLEFRVPEDRIDHVTVWIRSRRGPVRVNVV